MLVHHRINIWSSSTTGRKKLVRSFPQTKIELIVQSSVFGNLKMEVNTAKNLVKGSAEQTGNELPRGPLKQKFNERYCIRSNNELVTGSSLKLADDYYRKGNNDELSTTQPHIQESIFSRKCSKLCHGNWIKLFFNIKCPHSTHLYTPPY